MINSDHVNAVLTEFVLFTEFKVVLVDLIDQGVGLHAVWLVAAVVALWVALKNEVVRTIDSQSIMTWWVSRCHTQALTVLALEIIEVIIEPILTCEGWLHLSQWVLHAAAIDFRLLAQWLNRERGSSTAEHVPVNDDAVTPSRLKLILGILNLYRDARPEWFQKIILVAEDFEVQGVVTVAE